MPSTKSPRMTQAYEKSSTLTRREKQIETMLCVDGRSAKDTSAILGISTKTVEVHRQNIYKKRGVHSIAQLIAAYYRRPDEPEEIGDLLELTPGETEIERLLIDGCELRTIAERLGRGFSAVLGSVAAIYKKRGVGSRRELIAQYYRRRDGLVDT